MAGSSSDVAARLVDTYGGIEGFYVLNASGGLGYFSADGRGLTRETFDNRAEPIPPDDIDSFFSALQEASRAFPPDQNKELGYLLPMDDSRVWNTATLILHEHIAKDLKDALERDLKQGRMTLAEGDRKISDMTSERGLHRGFEDLLKHIGAFGTHTFFPVLYYLCAGSGAGDRNEHPMRVLNLMSLVPGTGRFTAILARMRHCLAERGALNQSSRVEHRFTLQE